MTSIITIRRWYDTSTTPPRIGFDSADATAPTDATVWIDDDGTRDAAWEANWRRQQVLDLLQHSNNPQIIGLRAFAKLVLSRVGPLVAAVGGTPLTWESAQAEFAKIILSGQAEV